MWAWKKANSQESGSLASDQQIIEKNNLTRRKGEGGCNIYRGTSGAVLTSLDGRIWIG